MNSMNTYPLGKKPENTSVKHKFSNEEYEEKCHCMLEQLRQIECECTRFLNSTLKTRMLKMNLEHLTEAIRYYFNGKTSRIMIHINNNYRESAKQIVQITRFLPETEEASVARLRILEFVDQILSTINQQQLYISELEDEKYKTFKLKKPDSTTW